MIRRRQRSLLEPFRMFRMRWLLEDVEPDVSHPYAPQNGDEDQDVDESSLQLAAHRLVEDHGQHPTFRGSSENKNDDDDDREYDEHRHGNGVDRRGVRS